MNAPKYNLRCIKYVNLHNVHKKIQFKEVSWFCRNIKKQFIMSHPRLLRNIIVIELRLEQRQKKTISHVLLHPATSSKYACVVEELF